MVGLVYNKQTDKWVMYLEGSIKDEKKKSICFVYFINYIYIYIYICLSHQPISCVILNAASWFTFSYLNQNRRRKKICRSICPKQNHYWLVVFIITDTIPTFICSRHFCFFFFCSITLLFFFFFFLFFNKSLIFEGYTNIYASSKCYYLFCIK